MKVKFVVTSVARLNRIAITSGQVIVTLDQIGYYYDFGGNRYKVNDGGSYVTFEADLDIGTKVGTIEIDGQLTDIYAPSMPVDLGDLENDMGFITTAVSNLLHYYTTDESYTKAEVVAKIDALGNIGVEFVDRLPTEDISTRTIYVVPRDDGSGVSDEYINTNGSPFGWNRIGDTDMDVSDLATDDEVEAGLIGHAKKSDVPTAISEVANDSNYAADSNYVHTDNNLNDSDKVRLTQIGAVSVTTETQEGNEIASITCDNVASVLHAPVGLLPRVIVSSESGAAVSAEKDGQVISFTEIAEETYKGSPTDYGIWNIVSLVDGNEATDNINIDEVKTYLIDLYHASALLIIRFPQGNTGYFGKYGEEPVEVPTNPGIITVTSGTYVATTEYNGITYTVEYVVDGTSDVIDKFCPDPNETGIAANVVATWLMYGNVTGSYANLNAVLADTAALKKLMGSSAAVDYLVRSTNWMSAIKGSDNAVQAIAASNVAAEKVLCDDTWNEYLWGHTVNNYDPYYKYLSANCPMMTSDTEPSGRVIYDSYVEGHEAYLCIGGSRATWIPENNGEIHYIGYDYGRDDILYTSVVILADRVSTQAVAVNDVLIQASKDGVHWDDIEMCTPSFSPAYPSGYYPIVNYCHPSALHGYRAARALFINGPIVATAAEVTVVLCNMWAHRYNNSGTLVEKTWNTQIIGTGVWHDGDDTYYTMSSDNQYKLNKKTGEWEPTTWTIPLGGTYGSGSCMWSDGEHTYYSSINGTYQYILNRETNDWDVMTWQNDAPIDGRYVWTDGTDYYFSSNSTQYVLDKSTNSWNAVSWNNFVPTYGSYIWSDGENTYYSSGSTQYVLNKSTRTWETKTWNITFSGAYVFVNNSTIYVMTRASTSYMLNKSTGQWETVTWNINDTLLHGDWFWTDGSYVYCNSQAISSGSTTRYLSYIWVDPK